MLGIKMTRKKWKTHFQDKYLLVWGVRGSERILTPPQSSFPWPVIILIVPPLASLEETANLQKAPCHNLCITKREMKTADKRRIMATECTHTRSRRVLYQTALNCWEKELQPWGYLIVLLGWLRKGIEWDCFWRTWWRIIWEVWHNLKHCIPVTGTGCTIMIQPYRISISRPALELGTMINN